MTIVTHPATRFAEARHHPVLTAVLAGLFWLAAATLVATTHMAAAGIVAVFVCAYGYTSFCARNAGVTHALSVGIVWLVLAIAAEIAMTTHLGHAWYGLLGTPDRPLLRNVFLFVWVFAPAFFARGDGGE